MAHETARSEETAYAATLLRLFFAELLGVAAASGPTRPGDDGGVNISFSQRFMAVLLLG